MSLPLRSSALGDAAPGSYERRRPELTLLHQVVAEHLESFLAEARADGRKGLPRYVEVELREYLECGILAHGFGRAVCSACGEEMVVAFSCKRRGYARRMCGTAAHLVDHVFPDIPVRQWVLSVPWELRLLLARHAGAFGALIRIFAAEVLAWQQRDGQSGGHRRGERRRSHLSAALRRKPEPQQGRSRRVPGWDTAS